MIITIVIYSLLTPNHSLWNVLSFNVYREALGLWQLYLLLLISWYFFIFVPIYNTHKISAKMLKSALESKLMVACEMRRSESLGFYNYSSSHTVIGIYSTWRVVKWKADAHIMSLPNEATVLNIKKKAQTCMHTLISSHSLFPRAGLKCCKEDLRI